MPSGWTAPVGVYPLFAIIGGAGILASWYLTRLAFGPDVVWNRKGNPHPWNTIKPHETTKLMDPYGRFSASWKRNAL